MGRIQGEVKMMTCSIKSRLRRHSLPLLRQISRYLSRHAIVCAFVSIYSNSSGLDNYLNRLSIGTINIINNHIANIPGCFSCSEISFQAILFFTLSMYFGCCRLYKNSYLRTHSISFSSSILVYECLSSGTSNEWLWGEASRQ